MDGAPTATHPYPTLQLGYTPIRTAQGRKKPPSRCASDAKKSIPSSVPAQGSPTNRGPDSDSTLPMDTAASPDIHGHTDHNYPCSSHSEREVCLPCTEKEEQIKRLQLLNARLKCKVAMFRARTYFSHETLRTDKKVHLYTGLPNRLAFDTLCNALAPKLQCIHFWRGPTGLPRGIRKFASSPQKFSPTRKVSGKKQLLMTLMKLRLGTSE